jgi:hypothetical protein
MADTKISALVAANALDGSETLPGVQGGTNRGITTGQINTYVAGATGLAAPRVSPTFTGVPVVPTAAYGTSTTQIASCAFVQQAIAGKHTIWMPAGGMRPSAVAGCGALTITAGASDQPDIPSLPFDATAEESAQFWVAMPKSWNEGTVTAQFIWHHAATTTNFGVVWGIQGLARSDDDPLAIAFGVGVTVTKIGGTTDDVYMTAETAAVTVGGSPAENDIVCFRVYRSPASGGDTMAIDAGLIGVRVFITTNAGTDT